MSDDLFDRFVSETTFSPELADRFRERADWGSFALGDYLGYHAEGRGDRPAVSDDETTVTWAELRDRADAIAAGLLDRGVAPGDVVAFQVPASVEWFALRLGVSRAGCVSVPVYPRFGASEIGHVVESVEPAVYVAGDDESLETASGLQDEVSRLEHVLSLSGAGGMPSLDELRADPAGFTPARIDPDRPDVLALSSGTTGQPKIYYIPQNTYLTTGRDVAGRCSVTPYDTVMGLAPVQQALGHIVALYLPLASGAAVSVTASNDPGHQWRRLAADRPDFVGAIPTQTTRLMNDVPDDGSLGFVRTWVNGGAPLPTEIAERAEELGATVLNAYGAGDGGWATTARPMDPFETRVATVGPANPGMEVAVVDEAGESVPTGEVGEVLLRGASCCFGYFDDEERTADAFDVDGPREGWFHTNDAGTFDASGNLRIVGRLDDMILRGGQNIYPAEVEDHLMTHDAVAEAAVIGVPDPELGERVGAYVVTAEGASIELDDVVAWFESAGLATFKRPERLEVVDELPRSPGGKIKKDALREDIEAKLAAEPGDG